MRDVFNRLGYVLFAALASVWRSVALQQTIRVDVNLVNVLATVLDKNGRFVAGLSRDDFRVYEDDIPQDVRLFEKDGEVQSSLGMLVDISGSMVDVLPFMLPGEPFPFEC